MLTVEHEKELKRFAWQIRMETIRCIAGLGVGHLGGSFSIADLLAVLYGEHLRHDPQNPSWSERDWLVCSKGHAGPAVYSALALRGFFPISELATLNRPGTTLPSHCDRNKTPGVDMTTGSLGQGASTAAGVALAHKLNGAPNHVYLILGDGELNEGQVWEMALFASAKKLHNLIAFVDLNKLQLDGFTDDICPLGDVARKFADFGWNAHMVDGHDIRAISVAIDAAKLETERPSMIVLDTVKGKGWSGSENTINNHSMAVSAQQLEQALAEMQAAMARL